MICSEKTLAYEVGRDARLLKWRITGS